MREAVRVERAQGRATQKSERARSESRASGHARRAGRLACRALAGIAVAIVFGISLEPAALAEEPESAPTASEAPATQPPRSWHATAFVSGLGSYRIIHYWSAGPAMRAETVIGGHPIATLVLGDRYVVADRLAGKALEVVRSSRAVAEDAGRLRPFAFEHDEIRAAGGEKVEETTLSGVAVEVWRVSDDLGRRTVWLSRSEPRLPLRVETFVRASSQTIRIDYSGWIFDLEIPPAFFTLTPGLEVERLSYEGYVEKTREGPVGPAPILYPDLVHGSKPQ